MNEHPSAEEADRYAYAAVHLERALNMLHGGQMGILYLLDDVKAQIEKASDILDPEFAKLKLRPITAR